MIVALHILQSLATGGCGAAVVVFLARILGFTSSPAKVYFYGGSAGSAVLLAVVSIGDPGSVRNGTQATVLAWLAWREWRRGRKRRPSRVLGRVRDLGHRLAVIPEPSPA